MDWYEPRMTNFEYWLKEVEMWKNVNVNVNVKDSYIYIFTSKSFNPDTVPLKWDPVELLHGDVVLSQDASDGGDAHMIYVVEHLPVCKYFLL